jgi:uncharacterized protein (DUF2236 family)
LQPRIWWAPPLASLPLRLITLWLLPPELRTGFGYRWGPRREALMRALARVSRASVPHLPRVVRDLPVARAADRRVTCAAAARRSGAAAGQVPLGARTRR